MVFNLRPQPMPSRCYMTTKLLKLETGLSGGLEPIARIWKVQIQPRPADTIRSIQQAMIAYEVSVGNMPETFTVQAWVTVTMACDPALKRHENRAKFISLCSQARLPFKCIERTSKPKIRNGEASLTFWSKGFPASVADRIYFLDGYKVLEIADLARAYPDVFPRLPEGLSCEFANLKAGDHRG